MNESTKLAIIGLSKAGKTSIYRRCFERHNLKDIEQTPPTIMIAQNLINLGHISKGISIWDFGGQKTFRDAYLLNPDYFSHTKIILFVVDILANGDFSEEKEYFSSIIKIFEDLKIERNLEKPKIFVFLHKCDPDKKNKNNEQIAKSIIEMSQIFGSEVPYFMTSIYDDSACRSLNNILFFSLPEEIINQVFMREFFDDIKKVISEKIKETPQLQITEVSKVFGDLLGRKLHDLWINAPLEKIEEVESKSLKSIITVSEKDHNYFKMRCPYYNIEKKCSEEDCIIVHGFIAGILTSLNLSKRSLNIKRIEENGDCYFIF